MNFLDYLVNAMSGGQPSAQELEMRKMAQQGLLNQDNSFMSPQEYMQLQGQKLVNQTRAAVTPRELQSTTMSPYMQNLINPGKTMQQNYIDPRLMEEMYYRGLLSR
jgi:hypothetical protein